MWKSRYMITPMYQYIALLNQVRKLSWNAGFGSNLTTALYTDLNIAATQKGPLVMILSNQGSESKPKKISIQTGFPTGSVLVDVITGQSIAVKHSTIITVVQGQPQIYLPHSLATQICSNIIPPPINPAVKFFHRFFFSKATTHESTITSWSNGLPVNTNNILKPPLVDVSSGRILQPPTASFSSNYSIFNATSNKSVPNGNASPRARIR
jgi:alpha-amylase